MLNASCDRALRLCGTNEGVVSCRLNFGGTRIYVNVYDINKAEYTQRNNILHKARIDACFCFIFGH